MSDHPRLSIVNASLARGGVGKMRVQLANRFLEHGLAVDFILAETDSPYLKALNPAARVLSLGTSNAITGVPRLAWYLRKERPDAVLTQRIRLNVLAHRARALSGTHARLYATLNTNLSAQLKIMRPVKARHQGDMMRRWYPRNDGLIAVSEGVRQDAAQLLSIPTQSIFLIRNPVVTADLSRKAEQALDDPWFAPGQPPVLLAVGRLEPQKDYPNLLQAFAKLRVRRPCRLLILGEGALHEKLIGMGRDLGIDKDLRLGGFVDNPYPYMRASAVYVLASRWEGSGNSLTEAVALGKPVVSTDCPDGPREILMDGEYGKLVPMGDAEALAAAIGQSLDSPPDPDHVRQAAERFRDERSALDYLRAMGFLEPTE
ncbi:MAG: glycosyltransferase [Chromatiales bacterium]|nr:glycosyltransferase [Chromatiales bacterium]